MARRYPTASVRLAGLFLAVAGLSLVGTVVEAVGIFRATDVQRGIDAHTVQVGARFADLVTGRGLFQDDVYVLIYHFGGRAVAAELRSLPGGARIGDYLCVEIDAQRPEHARVCGTRGGLDDARNGLFTGGAFLAGSLAVGGLLIWRNRIDRIRALAEEPVTVPDAGRLRGQELVLRPAPLTRWGMVVLIPTLPLWVAVFLLAEQWTVWPWPILIGMVAVIVGVRLYRVRIVCSDGVVSVVHPARPVRRIPAAAVTGVVGGAYPVINWRAPSGEPLATTAYGFWMGDPILKSVLRHHEHQLALLRAWIDANR
jgi:hypothetical protein